MTALRQTPSRGEFIRSSSAFGAGLALALALPLRAAHAADAPAVFAPNAWVRIAPDNTVTVMVSKSEMGQGVSIGLPTILADELDAAIGQVRFEFAPADPAYNDPEFGSMVTGGSTSVANGWMPLRKAGATARAMLITAAAKGWGVDESTCVARAGNVYHVPTSRSVSYGSLANAAATLPVPANVPLKAPDAFTLIGQKRQRPDIPLKSI
jgi:isoquinoline 1-oxidoreductase subunit beta